MQTPSTSACPVSTPASTPHWAVRLLKRQIMSGDAALFLGFAAAFLSVFVVAWWVKSPELPARVQTEVEERYQMAVNHRRCIEITGDKTACWIVVYLRPKNAGQ